MKLSQLFNIACLSFVALLTSLHIQASNTHPALILLPIATDASDESHERALGNAATKSLSQHYQVIYGAQVEEQLQQQFTRSNCTLNNCLKKIASALNSPLIADARISQQAQGYQLFFEIRDLQKNQPIISKSQLCNYCTAASSAGALQALIKTALNNDNANHNENNSSQAAVFIFDSSPSNAEVFINNQKVGTTPYQGFGFNIGDQLTVTLKKTGYAPTTFSRRLISKLVQLPKPIKLKTGEANVLVSTQPYKSGAEVFVNGKPFGKLPRRLKLAPGDHIIKVMYKGKAIGQDFITLEHGDSRQMSITLQ